ncbi:unnamed protein product [Lota lota]
MDASVCTYSRDIQSREEEVEDVQEEIRRRGSPPGGLREEQTSTSSGDESPCPSQNLFNNGHRRSDSLVSNWPGDGSSRLPHATERSRMGLGSVTHRANNTLP